VESDAPAGAACADPHDCRSREDCVCGRCSVARCQAPEDCAPGRTCRDSRCQAPCREDDECAAGETCTGGVCRQACAMTSECQAGEVCATEGLERRCVAVPCADAAGCRADETCRVQREPHAIDEPAASWDGGVILWLEIDGAVWRAVSSDGRRFALDAAPILDGAGAPSVARTAAGWELWVETPTGLSVALSSDGRAFGPPEERFPGDLHAPAAAPLPDGSVLVLAETAGALVTAAGAPLLDGSAVTDPLFWRDVSALGSPALLVEDGVVKMWFTGHGVESAAAEELGELREPPPNDSIGYAAAAVADPDAFQPWAFNPVFRRTKDFLLKQREAAPAVVRWGDRDEYRLYFVGEEGLRFARNPPPLP
jgi:hypothetical protein